MMKRISLVLVGVGIIGFMHGRQLLAPLSLAWDPHSYFYDLKGGGRWAEKQDSAWNVDLWGAAYERFADSAYQWNGCCQMALTPLFVGKDSFRLAEIFYDSAIVIHDNPWVTVATIKPSIEYNDKGVYMGATWSRDVEWGKRSFRLGLRGNMPVKMIEVSRRYNGTDAEREVELQDDMIKYAYESIGGGAATQTWAYRFDLVNALLANQTTSAHMVIYTGAPGGHTILIDNKNVTAAGSHWVHVKGGSATGAPDLQLGATEATVTAAGPLAADGAGLSNNTRAYFASATDYAPLDASPTNQSTMWLVPTFTDGGVIEPNASAIQGAIEAALKTVESSVIDYMIRKNIDLGTQKNMGAGDALLQLFMSRNWRDSHFFTEAHIGAVFPTGVLATNTLAPFLLPLGNNGHFEVEPGLDLKWNAVNWLSVHVGASYHWVLKARESVAAPFAGSCVKNIGPCVRANTSWQYALVMGDLTLVEPYEHHFGMNFGYEGYFKTCDKICLCSNEAVDLEGQTQALDANVLTRYTKVRSHKLKTEFFYNQRSGSIFGGFDYIVAGKNTPKDIGYHVGLLVEF